MSAAAFITRGLAWLVTAVLIALRLTGTGPARRVRQPLAAVPRDASRRSRNDADDRSEA